MDEHVQFSWIGKALDGISAGLYDVKFIRQAVHHMQDEVDRYAIDVKSASLYGNSVHN